MSKSKVVHKTKQGQWLYTACGKYIDHFYKRTIFVIKWKQVSCKRCLKAKGKK